MQKPQYVPFRFLCPSIHLCGSSTFCSKDSAAALKERLAGFIPTSSIRNDDFQYFHFKQAVDKPQNMMMFA
jgi:hypothetical protein